MIHTSSRLQPRRIRHRPGVVLEVVLSSPVDGLLDVVLSSPVDGLPDVVLSSPVDGLPDVVLPSSVSFLPVDSPPANSGSPFNSFLADLIASSSNDNFDLSETISGLGISTESLTSPNLLEPQRVTLTRRDTIYIQNQLNSVSTTLELARESGITLDLEQMSLLFNAEVTRALTSSLEFESALFNTLSTLQGQVSQTQQIAREVIKLHQQMTDRLTLIQNKTKAILTQGSDLSVCPIPRLFIVLPEEPTGYDPTNWFTTVFRLYFICECGEHTKKAGSRIPHHLHLANHEGYLVREPIEFFQKYGPFLLLMLELIKYGTPIPGHAVPSLASLKVVDLGEHVQQSAQTVIARINYSRECLYKLMRSSQANSPGNVNDTNHHKPITQRELADYLDNVNDIVGVDLRQLGSFLVTPEGAFPRGILRRMITPDGYFKWVCPDHYQAGCMKEHTEKLHEAVKLAGGKYDEPLGRVEITLWSRSEADRFFDLIGKTPSVLELIVYLKWKCDKNDLEAMLLGLSRSWVSVLHVDIRQFQPSLRRLVSPKSVRYGGVYRLLEPPNLKAIHIVLPMDLVELSNFTPRKPSHLRDLSYEIALGSYEGNPGKEVRVHTEVRETNAKVTTVYMWDNSTKERGAFSKSEAIRSTPTILHLPNHMAGEKGTRTLSEGLKSNSTAATLTLYNNSIGEKGAKAISEALKNNSTLATLILYNNFIGDRGAQLLSEALEINSALTTLDLENNSIGEKGAKALAEALRINSTLTTLDLGFNSLGDKGARAIFKALENNSSLTRLDLNDNLIGRKGAQALSEALKINSALTNLNLHGNPIGDKGVQALSMALRVNKGLSILNLWATSIGELGAQELAKALESNESLTSLDLWSNSIGDTGAEALSDALKTNSTLATLVLTKNSIRWNGALALAKVLKSNQTLTMLRMGSNSIGDLGAEALSDALRSNDTLTTLHLWDESIGEGGVQALREAHKTNATLDDVDWNDRLSTEDGARELSRPLRISPSLNTL